MDPARLRFLGANRQVTGSRTLLEVGDQRILIDCGLFQEREHLERNWQDPPVPPESIDAVLLTHGHLDHTGLLPRLVAQGYRGRVITTEPSVDIARIVMLDSARIHEEDAAYKKRRHKKERRSGPHPEVPLYTVEDAEKAAGLLEGVHYHDPIAIGERVHATFHEAGHILGAASIEIDIRDGNGSTCVVFSGDVGQWSKPLIKDPEILARADYVILESTYGDRDHPEWGEPEEQLEKMVNEAVKVRGTVVIPTFAIERAQELIYYLGRLVRERRIPEIPVFLDSPMAVDVTDVFRRFRHYLDGKARQLFDSGEPPLRFPGLKMVTSSDDSRAINKVHGPKVVLSTSGMCTAGRIKHHLRQTLDDPNSLVLFVGYQAVGTLGRQLLEGADRVRIHGRYLNVRARVERLSGFSAHGDQSDLLRWLGGLVTPPRQVFLNHGEGRASRELAKAISSNGWNVTVPAYRQEAILKPSSSQ